MRPISGYRQPSMGHYAAHQLDLPTSLPGIRPDLPVLHSLNGSLNLFLSDDRSRLTRGRGLSRGLEVDSYANQSYTLRVRFAALQSGWWFDETLQLSIAEEDAVRGYHGRLHFGRDALLFAGNESLTLTVAQADWHGVTFGDWRYLHAAIWDVRMCGVPQPQVPPYQTGQIVS
jgi:hypothetical protein